MPRSARARAGASLMPSPTIATIRPRPWSRSTIAALSAGRTSARTCSVGIPTRAATAAAVPGASPVTSHVSTPASVSRRTASARLGPDRIADREGARDPPVDRDEHDGPGGRRAGRRGTRPAGTGRSHAPRGAVDCRRAPRARPRRPRRSRSRRRRRPRRPRTRRTRPKPTSSRFARATIAVPSGCSLARSSDPARSSSSRGDVPGRGDDVRDGRAADASGCRSCRGRPCRPDGRSRAPRRRG